MKKINILNTREIKRFKEALLKVFGYVLKGEYAYLMNDQDKIFLINKDLARIELKYLKIDRIGFYFAEFKNGQVRLSKEGTQLLVKEAKENSVVVSNLVELTKEEVTTYFTGKDLEKDLGRESKSIILIHNDSVLGSAKYKEGNILNFLPKIHRGTVIL